MNPMSRRTRWIVGAAVSAALVAGGTGVAIAGNGGGEDGAETPITGSALDKASAAALEETGEGTVTGTEVGDEEGYYEIEVTLDDGSQVDVHLDADFKVLDSEADKAGEDEGDGGDTSGDRG